MDCKRRSLTAVRVYAGYLHSPSMCWLYLLDQVAADKALSRAGVQQSLNVFFLAL